MSTPLRVAVIGCGLIARLRHLPAFLECQQRGLVRIVGLCDTDPQSLAQAASLVGDCPQFSDYQTLLESLQPDLVAICTPPVTHAPIALAALAAGAHVFCEKPLATTVAEAQEMVAAAVRSGRRTGVNFRYRWIPAVRFARDIIRQGDLGPLTHLYLNYFNAMLADTTRPVLWRQQRAIAGAGVLADLGSHLIDLVRFWGSEFRRVTGLTAALYPRLAGRPVPEADAPDAVTFLAELDGGALAVFNLTNYAIGRVNHQRAEVYGRQGSLIYEINRWDEGGDLLRLCLGLLQGRYEGFSPVRVPPAYRDLTPNSPIVEFVVAVVEGREYAPSFVDGLRAQEVIAAVEAAAERLEWVPVERTALA